MPGAAAWHIDATAAFIYSSDASTIGCGTSPGAGASDDAYGRSSPACEVSLSAFNAQLTFPQFDCSVESYDFGWTDTYCVKSDVDEPLLDWGQPITFVSPRADPRCPRGLRAWPEEVAAVLPPPCWTALFH